MSKSEYLLSVIDELRANAEKVDDDQIRNAAYKILEAKKVFVAGAGRSGFAARAFSNRLMHLGLSVHFVGEPTTPAICEGDLLVIGSGSGETGSLVVMAEKARKVGAEILTVTINPNGKIGKMAQAFIEIPGATPKGEGNTASIQPMADAFEQMSWIVYDVIIAYLMEKMHKTSEEMFKLHANLE